MSELGVGGDARVLAGLWRHAARGANDSRGGFAWLDFPPDSKQYPRSRTLWLTRKPTDTDGDGAELLLGATL